MSLLNQVLQDLEKRNETNISEHHGLKNIQATPVRQSNAYLYIVGLISLLLLVFAIMYSMKETKNINDTTAKKYVKILINPVIKETIPDTLQATKTKTLALQKKDKPETLIIPNIKESITDKLQIKIADKKPVEHKKLKQLSNTQLASQIFTSAQKLTSLVEKQLKLEQALKLDMLHINARLVLANTLLQQGQTEKASTLLNQGTTLFPQNIQLINLRSQLFLQNKQARPALTLLQQVDDRYIQDETYLALLAAAYQQSNAPLKSLQVYQKLLSINSNKAEYWLGLAMAYEKQNHKQQALNAYQQALNKNSLKTAIVSYIKQRISILK